MYGNEKLNGYSTDISSKTSLFKLQNKRKYHRQEKAKIQINDNLKRINNVLYERIEWAHSKIRELQNKIEEENQQVQAQSEMKKQAQRIQWEIRRKQMEQKQVKVKKAKLLEQKQREIDVQNVLTKKLVTFK